MAELNTECCTPVAQETCCEPSRRPPAAASRTATGAAAPPDQFQLSTTTATATVEQVRETVREKYAAAATGPPRRARACCGPADEMPACSAPRCTPSSGESDGPEAAINASLGCGVPTAVADLHEGETVLDLGSGAGADVLISARRVGSDR